MVNCLSKTKQKICKHEWESILKNDLPFEIVCKKCKLTKDLGPVYVRLGKAIWGVKEVKK